MSHRKERKENNCLNCGAVVYGKFCHICGQENIEPKESFWNLFTHFIYDITHFDGKFFSTVKLLLLKPGFLSREYINGRRNNYLNPIRMYVFTSAFFFIYFFAVYKTDNYVKVDSNKTTATKLNQLLEKNKLKLTRQLADTTVSNFEKASLQQQLIALDSGISLLKRDSTKVDSLQAAQTKLLTIGGKPSNYKTIEEYDSTQQLLPVSRRDGWITHTLNKRQIELQQKYVKDELTFIKVLFDRFMRSFPQLLFFSLPIFALMLKLIYTRRKNYYYGDHGIYAVHVYCAMFIIIFIQMNLARLENLPSFGWVNYPMQLVFVYMFWYIYKSMRNFYLQSRAKTLFKFFLLFFIYNIMMGILFLIFFTISAFTI